MCCNHLNKNRCLTRKKIQFCSKINLKGFKNPTLQVWLFLIRQAKVELHFTSRNHCIYSIQYFVKFFRSFAVWSLFCRHFETVKPLLCIKNKSSQVKLRFGFAGLRTNISKAVGYISLFHIYLGKIFDSLRCILGIFCYILLDKN